jgi:hypothetical protein
MAERMLRDDRLVRDTAERWSFLGRLQRELRESIQAGAALASVVVVTGCGGAAAEETPANSAGTSGMTAPGNAGTSGMTATDSESTPQAELERTPAELVGCFGPTHSGDGFYGQCCFKQQCYVPEAGAACAALGSVPRLGITLDCSCGVEGQAAMTGPFALNPSALAPERVASTPEGSCCYVVGRISCDGRPFVVSGALRVAEPAWRDDWGLST